MVQSPERPNVAFYVRILSYFRQDGGRIVGLGALIWIALGAGLMEGAAAGALTNAVLSPQTPTDMFGKILVAPLAWLDLSQSTRETKVVWLALCWLLLRLINDTVLLFREMTNHRLRYN